ncbi:MAG TPA: AAA family ATPase [Anaerolineae bacterium]|nr:AAA family ATPase [Anaerolineae bacterium]HQH39940.1 AAA family ATPase [Anaerolineae bacterium]
MIVIINGPCGIGKSTTAEHLTRHFDRAVFLDGDYIGAVHPFEIYDEVRIEHLYQTLRHLIAFHIERGDYHNFVIPYVFESPESLARLRTWLADLDDEVYAFRLVCHPQVLEQRLRDASRAPDELAWYLNRTPELVRIQEAAAHSGDLGYVVDTTSRTPAEVADVIWALVHDADFTARYRGAS